MITFTPHFSSSSGNFYTASDGDTTLLLECGVPIASMRKAAGFRLSDACGCLLTHAHKDHSCGVESLLGCGVDIYMSKETSSLLRADGHRIRTVECAVPTRIGNWTILPFATEHDCEGSLGYLIGNGGEKLLFATDTYYLRPRFSGLSIIAVECNYSMKTISENLPAPLRRRLLQSHFSLENVIRFLASTDLSRCREIHLLHLSDENSDEGMFREEIEAATGKPVFIAKRGE